MKVNSFLFVKGTSVVETLCFTLKLLKTIIVIQSCYLQIGLMSSLLVFRHSINIYEFFPSLFYSIVIKKLKVVF